ncbi:MAG: nuclear transport factor 2 family protein [Mycobacterium sp.]|nr:nuclear transport factor 2 family protein [Mycobacterium sp.]
MTESTAYRDRADITEVLLRYATGIDRRDWATFRTVFTVDCVLDYGEIGSFTGVDAVTEFMDRSHAMAGHTMHRLSNIVITLDGDRATARTYVDGLILAPDNASGVSAVGIYDDDLVRADGGWRIARRVFAAVRITTVGG